MLTSLCAIYRTQAGSWRIKILGSHFKNKGRVGKDLSDVRVAGWLTNLVTDYVKEFRPVLIGDSPDSGYCLFPARKAVDSTHSIDRSLLSPRNTFPSAAEFRRKLFDISSQQTG